MTATIESRQWLDELLRQGEHKLAQSNSDCTDTMRHDAKSLLDSMKLPVRKDELWRYSNVDRLFSHQFTIANKAFPALQELAINEHLLPDLDSYQIVIANGHCLSDLQDLPSQVTIKSLSGALTSQAAHFTNFYAQASGHQQHLFSALNTALMNDGVFIHIGAGITLDKPIEVIYLNGAEDTPFIYQPRILVVVDKGASVTLIERYVNSGQSLYFNNNMTEITLHEDALLKHFRTQDESKQAYHMGSIFVSLMAKSSYSNTTIATGGNWARTDFNVHFKGEYASCNLNGLYTVGEQQLIDFHSKVQHSVANCSSQENFKGILYGKGRAVFDGHIVVARDAQGSDAHMSNANLLLTRKAEIDTKPQLEIYADNVKCSHGTTVGQLEPEQIFYLRSRGITKSRAKQILCLGFAAEIINTIDIESVANQITGQVQEQLWLANEA